MKISCAQISLLNGAIDILMIKFKNFREGKINSMTIKHPLVSVIMPTYNRAWTLKDAVDSVLLQDYPNIELVVIDDGSEDNTQELLETYKNEITVLRQENKGVSAARNKGIRQSRGEFIALLDSDDAWDKKKISCQMEFFKDHPEALICQTQEIWIRNGKKVNPKVKHKKPSGMIFEPSLDLCLVSPSAVMMKRQLFDIKGYFNEKFLVCEDYDLWLRVSSTLPVFLIDKPYTIKRGGHKDQLSNFHSQDKFRIRSLSALMESGILTQEQTEKAKKVFKKKCTIYGNGCIKRGKKEEGESYLAMGMSLDSPV